MLTEVVDGEVQIICVFTDTLIWWFHQLLEGGVKISDYRMVYFSLWNLLHSFSGLILGSCTFIIMKGLLGISFWVLMSTLCDTDSYFNLIVGIFKKIHS